MLRGLGALMLLCMVPLGLVAQPHVSRAQLSTLDASAGLTASIDRVAARREPAWIAWVLPRIDPRGTNCCWSDGCEGCWLEGERVAGATPGATTTPAPSVLLEGDTAFVVLVRVANGAIDKLRTVSASCPLDAGGLPFYTLTGVPVDQSLAWLEGQARRPPDPSRKQRLPQAAVRAIALHPGAEADAVLDRLLAADTGIRRDVVMAFGHSRGAAGLTRLERLIKEETTRDARRRVVQAIAVSREPPARALLLDLARRDGDADVRSNALVAVARLAGRDTTALLTEAIARDPDTEVKRRAVFGISRLPADESVPLLIKVAREHANPEVRRAAMFWLGQSRDPRAVEFFASVLK